MNTASKSAATKKDLHTFGIVSPLEQTAVSSPATIESEQNASKSSSPFDALKYKESTKLTPVSETTSASATLNLACTGTNTQIQAVNLLTNPTKSRNLPNDSHISPFLKENFCKQQIEESLLQNKNMLASTSGSSNSNSQLSNSAGSASIPTATSVSSPTNSIKNIKCDPYTTLSPCNENSQNMLEENLNNNSSSMAVENTIRERDGTTTTTSSMLRQTSNSSVNSVNASSPNNGSDHSNSSNTSNISQTIDSNADILPDLNIDKTLKKKNTNNFNVKDEDNGKPSSDKSNSSGTSMKNSTVNASTLSAAIKEEPGVINNLPSVKKEETAVTPNLSPVGFGSIEGTGRAITPVKNEITNTTAGNNNNNEKLTSNLNPSGNGGCSDDAVSGISNISSNDACNSIGGGGGGGSGGSSQHTPASNFNNTSGSNTGGSLVGNCMDYMQQQNHIFVFSTQLANKGADAVLNGQFPTIIAYHCTQPATKSFLEDFFIKNPMKMTKLQRQNSLNICSISVAGSGGGSQHWMGGCNNVMPKIQQQQQQQQKSNGGKINFANVDHKAPPLTASALRQVNIASSGGFPETPTDGLVASENDLMCWEQTRQSLEAGAAPEANHAIKMLDGGIDNKSSIGAVENAVGGNDGNIPSLQGVKVPDENLTPQQRQHREEQLAKLKKMNQFLFPENGNEFRPDMASSAGVAGKLNVDGGSVTGNLTGIMLNLPVSGQSMITSQIGNPLNPAMRSGNIPTNSAMNQQNKTPEHMAAGLGDDAPDIIGAHDMGGKATCSNLAVNSQQNISCGPGGGPTGSVANMPGNSLSSCHSVTGGNINGPGTGPVGIMPNSPEVIGGSGVFNPNCGSDGNLGGGPAGTSSKNMISVGMHPQDMNHHVGMAQMEWSKLQHQFFEERLKGNKSATDINLATMCRSSTTGMGGVSVNVRSNMAGSTCGSTGAGTGGGGGAIPAMRSAQGPPPPYHHPTQRSASVPIETQSPNPASPNNPTSNLSLPSPRTVGTLGSIPANSPNMDAHAPTMSSSSSSSSAPAASTTTTTSSSVVTTTTAPVNTTNTSHSNQAQKNSFQQDGSPQSAGCSGVNNSSNNNSRNRGGGNLNPYNSNPSTPLSHMSPKDLESFNSTNAPTADLKNARPSPQRSRTPLLPPNSNNLVESLNIEGRFPAGSIGLNFPTHMQNPANIGVNTYKGPCPIERQNSAPLPTQFCRRTDNLPLNPNSNRPPQNKLSHTFDPISSLAQMSQQLTSCVSLNTGGGGVGNSPGGGVNGMGHLISPNDMAQMSTNVVNQQNLESMMSLDGGGPGSGIMDHCGAAVALNHMGGGGGGMPPHLSPGVGPFMSGNCHINPMLGTMGAGGQQRMLNPKMCGVGSGFNPGNMRDGGPGSFHGVMPPTHRMMNRMAVNFGNFNLSPNIQVKASTPNTIQYMPVRPQNNNPNNQNMRTQPSLEFLQRYANPQMIMDNNGGAHMGQLNMGNAGVGDPNKLGQNPNNMPGGGSMNFFQNCNQMAAMEQEDGNIPGGGMLPNAHDMNLGGGGHASLIRGMRPNMRQQQHLAHSTAARMQAPGGGGTVMPQFPVSGGQTQESMECSDAAAAAAAALFGAGIGAGPGQMYAGTPGGGQQKNSKSGMNVGLCQNMSAGGSNNGQQVSNAGLLQNEQQHNTVAMQQQQQSPVNAPGLGLGPNSCGSIMQNHAHAMSGGGNNASSPGGGVGGNGNVVNYKSFVGPASNDLKYAQQYHSFQQQLYATSTRSQQGGGNGNIGPNPNTNPTAFFVNK